MSEETEDTLTSALEEAWEQVDETDVSPESDEQPSAEFDTSTGDDEFGGSSVSDGHQDEQPDSDPVQGDQGSDVAASDGAEREGASLDTPPPSLSPTAREKWKDTPAEVKAEFAKIDQRMEGMAQKYGHDATRARGMDQALMPFQQFLGMNGGAAEAIPAVLQTASILQMGSGPQKAEMVANIIKQFDIDVQTLDNLLVGQAPPPEVQQQQLVQQAVQQAVAPYQQQAQQFQAQQQYAAQQQQAQIGSEIQQFSTDPANEFYNDVYNDMADILDMAANRNMDMSLKDAYDRACQMHPEISKIINGRNSSAQVSKRKGAASSIHGSPGGSSVSDQPDSLHSAIEQAWENAGRM